MAAPQDWHTFIDSNVIESETKVACAGAVFKQILEHNTGVLLFCYAIKLKKSVICADTGIHHTILTSKYVATPFDILEDWNADSYACSKHCKNDLGV